MIAPGQPRLEGPHGTRPAIAPALDLGSAPGAGLHRLAHRQGAERQMRADPGTGARPLKRRGHGAAIGLPALVQETLQRRFRRLPSAALALRAVIRQTQIGRPGHRVTGRGHATNLLRHRHDRGAHEPVAPGLPAVARGQAPHDSALRPFLPIHALPPRPLRNLSIPRIGPAVAGFLVADQLRDAMRAAQIVQHRHGIADPQAQRQSDPVQIVAQTVQAFAQKRKLPPRGVGLLPKLGFHDVKRQNTSQPRRRRQRGVVGNPQVALEPADDGPVHAPLLSGPGRAGKGHSTASSSPVRPSTCAAGSPGSLPW